MPLEKMVEESNAAAEVQLKEKKSFTNKIGMILTEYIFTVGESYNLDNGDMEGEFLKITMTGGTVDGVTSFIDGAPEFGVGEKSFLLLKKIEGKIYLSNFTMGKYKIQEEEGKIYYISSVFPKDKEIGKVSKEHMLDMIKSKYKFSKIEGGDFKKLFSSREKIDSVKKINMYKKSFETRNPAQIEEENSGNDGLVAMWFFFLLFISTGLILWHRLKKGINN